MKKTAIFGFLAAFVLLSGCNDKGHDFVGHWADVKDPKNSYLDISISDGIYHVDVTKLDRYLTLKPKVNHLEAYAVSEEVLTIHSGLGNVDMRLEDKQIFFENHTYQKTQ